MTQAEEIVAAARSTLGLPWQHQGRDGGGLDCAGVVLVAAKSQGFIDWDIPLDYDRVATPDTMLSVCRKHLDSIDPIDLKPGDIVVLRYPKTNHIGIIGDYPVPGHVSIIHAQNSSPRMVVENRFCADWLQMVRATVIGCFRFPERV